MNLKKSTGISLILVFVLIFSTGSLWDRIHAKGDDFYESIIRFDDIIRKIKTHYVVDVPAESLIVYAINGMRGILDPHTSYFKEKDYNNLMIHTKGEFGGLGITISITNSILTIMAPLPIPNSPAMKAGLLAGDRIIKINGKSTKGIKLDEAVQKLRGKKGTKVTITIDREGVHKPFDVEVERDIIKIESVPYYGFVDKGNKIGYIKLISFTQKSGKEVEAAVRELSDQGMKALIFDLRSNPGGLLKQAVKVAEKFLPPGKTVVYTKGRSNKNQAIFKSTKKPVLDPDVSLLILVNQGSASASEIVAGAVQDYDRGIIMGNETFGKGSVQTILPLEKKHALKLTTAYYYTPSGRCINKLDNEVGEIRHEKEKAVEDKKEEGKDSAKVKREEFKTLTLGRTVYGGGGITPDVDVVPERYTPIEIALTRNTFLFRYVIAEHAKMKEKSIKINEKTFEVTDKIFKNFRTFLKKEDFEYSSPEQNILKELKESIDKSRKDPNDTSKVISGPLDKRIDQKFSDLEKVIDKEKDYAFTRHKAIINDRLKRTFLSVGVSQDAYYRFALKNDKYVQEAIKLLKNKQKYSSILKKGFKKDNI